MDKYNEIALKTISYKVYKHSINGDNRIDNVIGMQDSVILIKQDYDYTINQYYIVFVAKNIASISFANQLYKPTINPEFDKSTPCIFIPVNYNDKISELTIEFAGGILDPISVTIEYQDTDKTKYDKEIQKELNQKIYLDLTHGFDLINVFWDDVTKDVDHVVIKLYKTNNNGARGDRLVMSCTEKRGVNFKSITGLGFADYGCEITEYDKSERVIATNSRTCRLQPSVTAHMI